ncbi:Fe2+-enterobactin ABC transporter substrate-binding protein [Chromobacterium sphagni]|uniref:Fe2+-enterobactin ABC transporter substrate-binding protein n=1 Tax=Chromobacterium sphagni TaxID=1903179 RepID=A0A1S1WT45_9NEIS|nr:Fe2+-enterobactin ABC transporter substrate-binding protein [Chromobacterium sphagni]OHX10411.1 Fe2+-enterobactin ABC transporter substrate-binding protein [Chromobacterium sphagni]OHX19148.1 Fe2+-enterobactin ABC transporter substrate-binding protein [Chromobacterium sphagni]
MSTPPAADRRRALRLALASCLTLCLAACDSGAKPEESAPSRGGWPRTLDSVKGKLTLDAMPQRIVSTSVTLTGTLLAIHAPVVASGASAANSKVTDEQGFFTQWSEVAKQRGVTPLYQGEPNAEAIIAAQPDLIVMAGTGGDSALKLYEQLSQLAPTLVVNYDDKSWQELATLLGHATGREADARAAIAGFDAEAAAAKARIKLPPQPTAALVYYEDGSGANLWTPQSAQGKLLQSLGFTLATAPDSVKGNTSMGLRHDIIQLSGEKFAAGLRGRSIMLFNADQGQVAQVLANPFLADNPAVRGKQVYAAGLDTFRLDYYSARNLLERLRKQFG